MGRYHKYVDMYKAINLKKSCDNKKAKALRLIRGAMAGGEAYYDRGAEQHSAFEKPHSCGGRSPEAHGKCHSNGVIFRCTVERCGNTLVHGAGV